MVACLLYYLQEHGHHLTGYHMMTVQIRDETYQWLEDQCERTGASINHLADAYIRATKQLLEEAKEHDKP